MTQSITNKNIYPWLIIFAIILGSESLLGYFARNIILGKPADVYAARIGNLTQTVVASGRVMTPQLISIAAETTGRVKADKVNSHVSKIGATRG